MAEKRVTIRHEDGREYSIEPQKFRDEQISRQGSYAKRGFRIVSYVDGTPYDGPKTLAEIEAVAAPTTPAPAALPPSAPKRSARNASTVPDGMKGEADAAAES